MGCRNGPNTLLKTFFVFDRKPSQSFGNLRYGQNSTIKLLLANVVFYHIESFSENEISKNVKITEIY